MSGRQTFTPNTGIEKAELIPTVAYGDGRPQDPGYDRAIIHGLNGAIDHKTAYQSPCLWSYTPQKAGMGIDQSVWAVLFCGPIFLGFSHYSTVITRSLTVAPYYRSTGDVLHGPGIIRCTLSRMKPQDQVAQFPGYYPGGAYSNPAYSAEYSQTATWQSASTTWQVGEDKTLSIGAKDLQWGYAWLVVEGTSEAECRGLAKCKLGPRTNTALANALLRDVATVQATF